MSLFAICWQFEADSSEYRSVPLSFRELRVNLLLNSSPVNWMMFRRGYYWPEPGQHEKAQYWLASGEWDPLRETQQTVFVHEWWRCLPCGFEIRSTIGITRATKLSLLVQMNSRGGSNGSLCFMILMLMSIFYIWTFYMEARKEISFIAVNQASTNSIAIPRSICKWCCNTEMVRFVFRTQFRTCIQCIYYLNLRSLVFSRVDSWRVLC